jgi:hypothetical protein
LFRGTSTFPTRFRAPKSFLLFRLDGIRAPLLQKVATDHLHQLA